MKQQELEKSKEYKYGFTTDIESVRAPKGLNKEVIRFISKIKKEPEWMLNWRLKAYDRLKNIKEPNWQKIMLRNQPVSQKFHCDKEYP